MIQFLFYKRQLTFLQANELFQGRRLKGTTHMFDLKKQLLDKGLITKEQADKVAKKAPSPNKSFAQKDRERSINKLKSQNKSEQYVTIRKWVELNRLDKSSTSIELEKFFVATEDQVTWLSLSKEVIEKITNGDAGVVNYMSNYGLTHAVVPRDIAEDIALVFPQWIKTLNHKK